MKAFQFKLAVCIRSSILKEALLTALLFSLFNLNAQVKNNIKLGIETGFLPYSDSENLGLFLNVEPKLRVSENNFMGVRFGVALNPHSFENNNSAQFNLGKENDHAVISFVPTFDYYLNKNNFRPYLGLGLGFYLFSDIDVSRFGDVFEVSVNNQIGFLLRGGFESGKLRVGLEYNFIPKADIEIPSGEVAGTVDSSYIGLSIGFIIGGGKS